MTFVLRSVWRMANRAIQQLHQIVLTERRRGLSVAGVHHSAHTDL